MTRPNPLNEAADAVSDLIRRFTRDLTPSFCDLTSKPSRLFIGDHVPEPADVEARYNDLLPLARAHALYPELVSLFTTHPIVASRIAKAREYEQMWRNPDFFGLDRFLASGPARAAHLSHLGIELEEAIADVSLGFEDVVRDSGRPVFLLATFPGFPKPSSVIRLSDTASFVCLDGPTTALAYEDSSPMSPFGHPFQSSVAALRMEGFLQSLNEPILARPEVDGQSLEHLNAAVAFLQLFIDDRMRADRFVAVYSRWYPSFIGRVGVAASTMPLGPEQAFRHLYSGELPTITDDKSLALAPLWGLFSEAMTNQRFRRGAARYAIASQRISDEDSVIDLCIALDALFGTSDGPVIESLSRRYAAAVGKTLENRKQMVKELRALYGVRSALVHGDNAEARIDKLLKVVASGNPALTRRDFGVVPVIARRLVWDALYCLTRSPKLLEQLDDVLMSAGFDDIVWMNNARQILNLDPHASKPSAGVQDAQPITDPS